jgi:hypothetical protein
MINNQKHKDPFGSVIRDIPRTHTIVKCWVYSHIHRMPHPVYEGEAEGKINCSIDIRACDTNKNIKGGGSASFTLAPGRNYLNMIFPNDYVFIYFDPGDGRGSILTFFGLVDRIQRSTGVDGSTGVTDTIYNVECTDFTKFFIMTNIYFNSKLMAREELNEGVEITSNLGGIQFFQQGVTLTGSPADFALSLIISLFGFGSQCKLPKSFPVNKYDVRSNRSFIKNYALKLLPAVIRSQVGDAAAIKEFESNIKSKALEAQRKDYEKDPKKENKHIKKDSLNAYYTGVALSDMKLPKNTLTSQAWVSYKRIITSQSKDAFVLDLFDLSLIEDELMDGQLVGQAISWTEGSLWELINSFSNDFVNELFCDLRPVAKKKLKPRRIVDSFNSSKDGENSLGGVSDYVVENDEIESANPGEGNTGAVRFVPSIIMREYPFSTIQGIVPPPGVEIMNKEVGIIHFGAIFSSSPDVPGRHIVKLPTRSMEELHRVKKGLITLNDLPYRDKHLDVAVINTTDISRENVGRSDADHVNLIELYTDITSGQVANSNSKYLDRHLNPLLTPSGMMIHGVRTRKYESPFGKFSNAMNVYGGTVDSISNIELTVRWLLLVDHWYQHNIEYLNGTISTRSFPEIRVGYRLDVADRHESYYIEGVANSWTRGQTPTTTFTVTRGQRNDPYPVYVLPPTEAFGGERSILRDSRLKEYFEVMNTQATGSYSLVSGQIIRDREENFVDKVGQRVANWATKKRGYIRADQNDLSRLIERESRNRMDDGIVTLSKGLNKIKKLLGGD